MRPLPLQSGLVGPETLPLLLVIAGLGLSLAEALAPGAHFVVLGVALLLAGLLGLLIGPFASPFVLAVFVVVFGAVALYGYRELDLYGGKGQGQTTSSDSLRGETGRVTETVTPTSGEVKLDSGGFNPFYAARSVDGEIAVGEEVMVIDPGGGNVLTVESLAGGVDDIDRELARERERRPGERDDAVPDDAAPNDAVPDEGASAGREDETGGDATVEGDEERDTDLERE